MTINKKKTAARWTAAPRNWAPRLYGIYYCSSACGCDCKKVDYDAAVKAAQATADTLGKSWKPVIWENFGWHWRLEKCPVTVRGAFRAEGFEAEICHEGSRGFLQFFGEGTSATAAVKHAIRQFEHYMREHNAVLEYLQRLELRLAKEG